MNFSKNSLVAKSLKKVSIPLSIVGLSRIILNSSAGIVFFAVSNPIISNIDYTIEYLKNLKPEAQRFLITSKDRAKGKELNKNANVIYDIQEFIKLIA